MNKPLRLLVCQNDTEMDIIEYHAQGITREPFLKKVRISSRWLEYQNDHFITASPSIFTDPSAVVKYYGWPYERLPDFVYWQKKYLEKQFNKTQYSVMNPVFYRRMNQ
jgi:hypothetical protein